MLELFSSSKSLAFIPLLVIWESVEYGIYLVYIYTVYSNDRSQTLLSFFDTVCPVPAPFKHHNNDDVRQTQLSSHYFPYC